MAHHPTPRDSSPFRVTYTPELSIGSVAAIVIILLFLIGCMIAGGLVGTIVARSLGASPGGDLPGLFLLAVLMTSGVIVRLVVELWAAPRLRWVARVLAGGIIGAMVTGLLIALDETLIGYIAGVGFAAAMTWPGFRRPGSEPRRSANAAASLSGMLLALLLDLAIGKAVPAGAAEPFRQAMNVGTVIGAIVAAFPGIRLALKAKKHLMTSFQLGLLHLAKKEYHQAIVHFSKAIERNPHSHQARLFRAIALETIGDLGPAAMDYIEAVRLDPKDMVACNRLGWILSTCPDASLRDGKKALEYAKRACELSEWKYPGAFHALAAAYAEVGDFTEAVAWQKKAINVPELSGDQLQKARRILKLYEEHTRYRMESADESTTGPFLDEATAIARRPFGGGWR